MYLPEVLAYITWLVVLETGILFFPFSWECHHPNWRTPSFSEMVITPPTSIYMENLWYIYIYNYIYIGVFTNDRCICHLAIGIYITNYKINSSILWGLPSQDGIWVDFWESRGPKSQSNGASFHKMRLCPLLESYVVFDDVNSLVLLNLFLAYLLILNMKSFHMLPK